MVDLKIRIESKISASAAHKVAEQVGVSASIHAYVLISLHHDMT